MVTLDPVAPPGIFAAPAHTTGPLTESMTVRYRRTMSRGQTITLGALLAFIVASGGSLLWLLATHAHVASVPAMAVLSLMLALETIRILMGIPVAVLAFRACDPIPMRPVREDGNLPRIALLTTIVPSKEPIEMARATLIAMLAVEYEGVKDVYLLDEGDDPACQAMCAELGVRHFSRKGTEKWNTISGTFKTKTKSGNHNAWRDKHESSYDIVGQMDPDHVPFTWFLERTVGYFNDVRTAFVVCPQVYGNSDTSWIARGAAQMAYLFEALVQRGANGFGAPILIGTNHLYRTRAWRQIGGYQDCIIEDHLTSMKVYATTNPATGGPWRGVYSPDIVAIGAGPTTFTDWYAQQMRWAWGMWQIVTKHSPRLLRQMSGRQRISYLLLQPFYPAVAAQWLLSVALTTAYIISNVNLDIPFRLWALCWGSSLVSVVMFWLWAHKFNLEAHSRKPGMTGLALMLMTIPVYTAAALRWLCCLGLPYVITAKGDLASPDRVRTFRPHLVWLSWMLILLALVAAGVIHAWPLIVFWTSVTAVICASPIVVHLISQQRQPALRCPGAFTADLATSLSTVQGPTALSGLRHNATRNIVPIYQLDTSGRRLAVARLTREPR